LSWHRAFRRAPRSGFLRQVKAFTEATKTDLRAQLGPEFAELELEDLNPRTFVRKNLLGEGEELRGLRDELNQELRQDRSDDPGDARHRAGHGESGIT
jgi:sec-independent protein translocase protein TatB